MNRIIAVASMLAVAALAGCADSGDGSSLAAGSVVTVRIPMGAASEGAGLMFVVDEPVPQQPDRIRWINKDVVTHTIMAMGDAPVGGMVSAPGGLGGSGGSGGDGGHGGHGDGHTDHDHGTSVASDPSSGMMFSFALPPGGSVEVPMHGSGAMNVHCMNHPWLSLQWWNGESGFVAGRPFWVQVDRIEARLNETGDTAAGDVATVAWPLPEPNLKHLEVLLSWNDSADDTAAGETANPGDTLYVEIIDPAGNVVASATQKAREAALVAAFDAPARNWPDALPGSDLAEAQARLAEDYPDDGSLAGDWSVLVRVDAAPGAWPDGAPGDLPGSDGHQIWHLAMTSVHERVTLSETQPTAAGDAGGHEHDHGGHGH